MFCGQNNRIEVAWAARPCARVPAALNGTGVQQARAQRSSIPKYEMRREGAKAKRENAKKSKDKIKAAAGVAGGAGQR